MKKGTKFYLISKYGKFLRKITYIKKNKFEWANGYARVDQLAENTNSKSKVRYILNVAN